MSKYVVTLYAHLAGQDTHTEMTTDAFLESVRVLKRGTGYETHLANALRSVMPEAVMREYVADLLSLLEPDDQKRILREFEEVYV